MFRHPQTHHLDTVKIQQHVASIEFLAELLAHSTRTPQKDLYVSLSLQAINKYVEGALQAIQQLEDYRDLDYLNNETKRAEKVLNSVDMFKRLYKVHLKNSEHQIAARALKNELRDYSTSVASMIGAINEDRKEEIADELNQQYEDALANQADEEMYHDFDLISREIAAERLASYVANQEEDASEYDSSTSDDETDESYVYFEVGSDSEKEQSGLYGSFNSEMEETEPLLVADSTEYDSDVSENSDLSETEELAPQTPKAPVMPRRLSFVYNWSDYSNSETEESLTASADDEAEESEEFSLDDLFSSPSMKR